jgi:hypothetical protein
VRLVRQRKFEKPPKLSIILLDWSVREDFHVLEYLNRQRIDRNRYEVLWIENYNRIAAEIQDRMERCENLGLPLPVDTWIVMERPEDECYHKHRMYNTGILRAQGEIIMILDSDAILKMTFVETIIEAFEKEPNLALHIEELRNHDPAFYPFAYPTIDTILGPGCTMPYEMDLKAGRPAGYETAVKSLKQDWEIMHLYNYGACFSARREDIIRIGGSDEHVDYMGHICGPYELTFRLINAGLKDSLHPHHFIYHVYHPNQGGTWDYCGPNNGKGMSTTAMAIPQSGRILPLAENEDIRELRLKQSPSARDPISARAGNE